MGRRVFELSYRCTWFWGCFVSGNKADLFPPLLRWRICCQHCQTKAGSTSPASHTESAEGHCAGDGWVALGDRSRRWLPAGMQMLRSHLSLSPTVLKLGCFPSGSGERLLQEVPKGCAVQTPAEGEVRIALSYVSPGNGDSIPGLAAPSQHNGGQRGSLLSRDTLFHPLLPLPAPQS